ncbi:MAG: LacI family transcriptional regulator [Lachnospiraceae bacterium]|nr:LacI family transcriptional regulator [Lachnospiraceae bacterium]MCI9634781.1 LacI family transcriptional regulator [Ruminococcus sp.]
MNIYDISTQAGVSIATVSRVLNGSDKVSDTTRQKVLEVIEKNRYMPNAFARSLGLNSMSTVGILCSDSSDVYLAQAVYYLERELRSNSYTSMLCCTGYTRQGKEAYLQLLLSRNVDAVFFVGSHFIEATPDGNSYILEAAKKIPLFILNGELTGDNIYSILCDDYRAAHEMADLLFDRGSKNPIMLYRILSYSGHRKVQGFLHSCQEHNITDKEHRTFSCPGPLEDTCRILERIRESGLDFDSVVTADDELAVGAVKYASRNGLRIPEDFQITGYNNSVLANCSTPEITTLDNQVEFMCTTAVSQMMQVFQKHRIPSRTMFSGYVVEQKTTRK